MAAGVSALKATGVRKYFYDSLSGQRRWESREALELLDVFENHHYLFGIMSSDEDVWILMASALQDKGMEVTSRQVNKKWARMRETFQKIGDARLCDATTKELQKPLLKAASYLTGGERAQGDAVQRYLAATLPLRRQPLSQPRRTAPQPSAAAGTSQMPPLQSRLRADDYETLRTMYKLSLLA